LEWTSRRYGSNAAPYIIKALKRTDDIWEHSTNSFGFYSTSAHGHIAPFFRGPYNAYSALWDVGPMRSHGSRKLYRLFQHLLDPNLSTINKVVKERAQATEWAFQSLSDFEKAKPYLQPGVYAELYKALQLQLGAAQLWQELGDCFFTGLALLRSASFSNELLDRLYNTGDRALRKGQQLATTYGRSWPVTPDADGRGTTLELAIAGLWGEMIDRVLQKDNIEPYPWIKIPPKPFTWGPKRTPRSAAEKLYTAILEVAGGKTVPAFSILDSTGARLKCEEASLIVIAADGTKLRLPTGIIVTGPEISTGDNLQIEITKNEEKLVLNVVKK
jgi:hypothetical protein